MNKSMITTLLATALSSQFSMAGPIHLKDIQIAKPAWVTESSSAGRNGVENLVESVKKIQNKPDHGPSRFNDQVLTSRNQQVQNVVELPDGTRKISTNEIFELDGKTAKEKISEFQTIELRNSPAVDGQLLMGRTKHELTKFGDHGEVLERRMIEIVNPPSRMINVEQFSAGRLFKSGAVPVPDFVQGAPFRVSRAAGDRTLVIETDTGLQYELTTNVTENQRLLIGWNRKQPRGIDLNHFILKSADDRPAKSTRANSIQKSAQRLDAMGADAAREATQRLDAIGTH